MNKEVRSLFNTVEVYLNWASMAGCYGNLSDVKAARKAWNTLCEEADAFGPLDLNALIGLVKSAERHSFEITEQALRACCEILNPRYQD